jgi:hypothetical protein
MEDSRLHRKKCNSIFLNLLDPKSSDFPAEVYIREFIGETRQCDDVFSFAEERKRLADKVNGGDPTRMERIMSHTQTQRDESFAAQALVHYKRYFEGRLVDAVDWPSRIHYYTLTRAEATLASVGLGGAGFGGLKAAQASFRKFRQMKDIQKAITIAAATPSSEPSSEAQQGGSR